jgi:hypothetical protein
MQRRPVLLVAAVALILTARVDGAPPPKPPPAGDKAAAETEAFLRQMGDAQKWMGEELWRIKEKVDALPGLIAEAKEGDTAVLEDVAKLRDEVKGLYVELSTVKQQIEEVKEQIAGVDGNLSGFRTSSGIFLAFVVLMVILSTVMQVLRR